MKFEKRLALYFVAILAISFFVEASILTYGFLTADSINCNWVWCEFTKESNQYYSNSFSECYVNNIKVNCTEIKDKEHFCSGERCEINGVTDNFKAFDWEGKKE